MGFRFRLGPFTFGSSGTRLSLWRGSIGFSAPLSGEGRTYGKLRLGPVTWSGQSRNRRRCVSLVQRSAAFTSEEAAAIEAFRADSGFQKRLQKSGVPWRGIQERLKEELPPNLSVPDDIAFGLVPKAMNEVFGQQGAAWTTEKRPSKSGFGETTWVVVKR